MSDQHLTCAGNYLKRKILEDRPDSDREKEIFKLRDHWKKILERVVYTVLFIAEKGRAFRGSDEKIGSKHNGNFMGILELISNFDQTLNKHIEKCGNPGSGSASYLSETICEEEQLLSTFYELVSSAMQRNLDKSQFKCFGLFALISSCLALRKFLT